MSKLTTALIGCGQRGPAHADMAVQSENFELVAVCDIDETRAKATAEKYGVEAVTDHKELLSRSDLDTVMIGTHTRHHFAPAMDAVAAGKHFFMEKPMVSDVDEAKQLCDAAKAAGVVGTIGYQNRFAPFMEKIKEVVDAIDVVQIVWTRQRGYMNPQYFFPDHYGGIIDTLSHEFDLVLWFMGWKPTAVYAQMHRGIFQPEQDAIEFVDVCIECEKDGQKRTAVVSGSLAAVAVPNVYQFIGKRGCLSSPDRGTLTVVKHEGFSADRNPINPTQETFECAGGLNVALLRQYDDFANAIRTGGQARVTLEQAMMATAVSQYAAESAAKGQRIAFDL